MLPRGARAIFIGTCARDTCMRSNAAEQHVILSGCSGGGKSTLLAELNCRGFRTVEEPGRRIVADEIQGEGCALPWVDPEAFARSAIAKSAYDRESVRDVDGWVFFDRGLVDASVALEYAVGVAAVDTLSGHTRFYRKVFLTPPWPGIYRTDVERRHGLNEGTEEYHRLLDAFDRLKYEPVVLPKIDIVARATFILDQLR